MKLSTAQRKVIDLMKSGWEMGVRSSLMEQRCWLQKDGVGRGGETHSVNGNTFNSLHSNGLIEQAQYGFPTSKYRLTAKGKEA